MPTRRAGSSPARPSTLDRKRLPLLPFSEPPQRITSARLGTLRFNLNIVIDNHVRALPDNSQNARVSLIASLIANSRRNLHFSQWDNVNREFPAVKLTASLRHNQISDFRVDNTGTSPASHLEKEKNLGENKKLEEENGKVMS
ncbi:hypothetical protein P5V15_002780 [Pogonomyrmex californicus]